MVLTINSAVSGVRGWIAGAQGFLLGAFAGGMAVVSVALVAAHVLTMLPPPVAFALAGMPISLGILREIGIPAPVPYRKLQVPDAWRTAFSPSRFGFAYGAVLGVGFATLFVTSAHMAMVVGVGLAGSLGTWVQASILWALGKSMTLLASCGAPSEESVLACLPGASRDSYSGIVARKAAGILASLLVLMALATQWDFVPWSPS